MLKIVTSARMKAIDRFTSNTVGIPSMVLMERAALAVADKAREMTTASSSILVLCGQGGNGGDGFAAARLLLRDRPKTEVFFCGDEKKISHDCASQRAIYAYLGGQETDHPDVDHGYDLIIDGIFGVGLSREIAPTLNDLFNRIRAGNSQVLSIDIPSGIDADNGHICGNAIWASETITFQFLKRGHILYPGAQHCGHLTVVDVGIVCESIQEDMDTFAFEREDIARLLPPRVPRSNKGTYGHALIAAGRKDMAGCALLGVRAAMAVGTGLVMGLSARENRLLLQSGAPEALYRSYPENSDSPFPSELSAWATAAAVGPGIGIDQQAEALLHAMLQQKNLPLVIDADALTLLANMPWLPQVEETTSIRVITPHPGEMARLLHLSVQEVLDKPVQLAQKAARKYHAVVVLKDAATVVTDGVRIYLNRSGCDGMASGGSGDVLTGMLCGLLAQGMSTFDAACLSVYIHGLAGEEAQQRKGARSMQAGDIVNAIAQVLQNVP